ncbi:MAG TPA: glutathionylspermidine synthase family protein [Rubricoccaceae bacterium]|jgi:glutathionylspermidine synthase
MSDAPIRLRPAPPVTAEALDRVGWGWLAQDADPARPYLAPEMVEISAADAETLALAGNELYALLVEAAEHVLEKDLLDEVGVPAALHHLVRHSWDDDRHWHLYGRFDLAGGVGGLPVRLIEFNADTATAIPETAIAQWAQAQGDPEAEQFNELYERLVEQFGRLKGANDDLAPTLLCTGFADAPEDDANLGVVGAAAEEAGFRVTYRAVSDVHFAPGEGVFTFETGEAGDAWVRHDFMFKLIPWETFASDEPAILEILEGLILDRHVVVVNPAYAVLLQSKRLMKVAYDLHPDNPLLLEAAYHPIAGKRHVEKPAYGREGGNVTVYGATGEAIEATAGDYDVFPSVFQAFTDLPHDAEVRLYQTGLFWAFEACAVGFRRGDLVMDDRSAFVGHVVVDG